MKTLWENIKKPWCLAVLLSGALFASLVIVDRDRHQIAAPPLPTVLQEALETRDAVLYLKGESEAFTGYLVEHYETGALKSRSLVRAGRLDGLSEGWYPDGALQVQESFERGVSHGVRRQWYADGGRMSETEIVEGTLEGTYQKWHENGQLAESFVMLGGQPHGRALAFYPSGCLKTEAMMKRGEVVERRFWKDGERNHEAAQLAQL